MRIGINVPDDLLKRFEPIKQITNVSQVCRDAIKAWVDTYEAASERASEEGMEEVSARLSQQVSEQTVDWGALGVEDAKLWCQLASLKDFQYLFHNLKLFEREGRSPEDWIPFSNSVQGTKTVNQRLGEHNEWFVRQYELDIKVDLYRKSTREYNRGWLCYVTSVWQMVQDRVAADARTRMEALQTARAKIEVPDHLASTGQTM